MTQAQDAPTNPVQDPVPYEGAGVVAINPRAARHLERMTDAEAYSWIASLHAISASLPARALAVCASYCARAELADEAVLVWALDYLAIRDRAAYDLLRRIAQHDARDT